MDSIQSINTELTNLRLKVEEQKKIIEEKDKPIETLDRELVKCKPNTSF